MDTLHVYSVCELSQYDTEDSIVRFICELSQYDTEDSIVRFICVLFDLCKKMFPLGICCYLLLN